MGICRVCEVPHKKCSRSDWTKIVPYEAKKEDGSENWVVVNTETGDVKATHEPPDAEEKAKRQVELLHEVEKNEGWNEGTE